MTNKEMEEVITKVGWKAVKGGWQHPDREVFGPGVYTLRDAYRVQMARDKEKGRQHGKNN